MGSLLVITGPPGAGKSTVSALVAASFDRAAVVEGDAVFGSLASGELVPWLPESEEQNDAAIDPRHVLTDPPADPEGVRDLVLDRIAAGQLTVG